MKSKTKPKSTFRWFLLLAVLVVVIILGLFFATRMEGQAPVIAHDLKEPFVGESQEFVVDISETGRGLQSIRVSITQNGQETLLTDRQFEGSMFGSGSEVMQHQLPLTIDVRQLTLEDGEALMRIEVRDYAWRNWWHGNLSELEVPIVVDTRAPQIEVLSRLHYVNQGGSGLVVYRISESCPEHGVLVGDHFFPGYAAGGADAKLMIAFFAVAYHQGGDTPVRALATDFAGNQTKMGFHCRIRSKSFRTDILNVSDSFIRKRIIPLLAEQGNNTTDLREAFLAVNRDMRKSNYDILAGLGPQSASEIMWEGPFQRLPKAANRAQFADHRIYRYKGVEIDRQVHLGADLASTQLAPVPAANSGVVVFADKVGIYGNTVVIDHCYGLLSQYAHLSSIAVENGDRVNKKDIIGQTGVSGLAVGDHLHFGMMVNDTFVNPVEWWDAHWINDNILSKLKLIKAPTGAQN